MKRTILLSTGALLTIVGLVVTQGSLTKKYPSQSLANGRSGGQSLSDDGTPSKSRQLQSRDREVAILEAEEVAPDIGPSVREQIKEARGIFFNFSCACCGDHLKYAKVLAEHHLEWPRIWDDLEDELAFHNLKFREEQAVFRILKDPHSAVDFMQAQIDLEKEKLDLRNKRQPWDESREQGGAGDLALFKDMLESLSGERREAILLENLPAIKDSPAHINAAVASASRSPRESRLLIYARLADEGLLAGSVGGQNALAELSAFTSQQTASHEIPFADLVTQGFENTETVNYPKTPAL